MGWDGLARVVMGWSGMSTWNDRTAVKMKKRIGGEGVRR